MRTLRKKIDKPFLKYADGALAYLVTFPSLGTLLERSREIEILVSSRLVDLWPPLALRLRFVLLGGAVLMHGLR